MIPILINCLMISLGLIEMLSASSLTVIVSAILTMGRGGAAGSRSACSTWTCGSGAGGMVVTLCPGTETAGGGIGVLDGASFKPAGATGVSRTGSNGTEDGCSRTVAPADGSTPDTVLGF